MKRVTMDDIAGVVGLSKFAVSRSLSGKSGVSEETRRLVAEAAATLGYSAPSPRRPSHEIGLVFHDHDPVNSELHMRLQNGIEREALRLKKPVRLQRTHIPEQIADLARVSAGLLLVGPHDRATVETVRQTGVPVVRLGWVDPLERVDQVIGADHEAGQAVADYLIGLGHRSIAFVQGPDHFRGRQERFYGAREVAEGRAGVVLHHLRVAEDAPFAEAFEDLRRQGTPVTAVFCAYDGLAVTVVSELLALGYRIPDDVSVIGFGDFAAATQISPQLTTVHVEGQGIGAAALRLLIERIESGEADAIPPRRILIVPRIVERRSTAAAAAHGAIRAARRRA